MTRFTVQRVLATAVSRQSPSDRCSRP